MTRQRQQHARHDHLAAAAQHAHHAVVINFADNRNLDGMGFSPFGKVTREWTW